MDLLQSLVDSSIEARLLVGGLLILSIGGVHTIWQQHRHAHEHGHRGDPQLGLKLVLFFSLLIAVGIVAGACERVLGYLLAGAKAAKGQPGWWPIKQGIAEFAAGSVGIAAILFLFLPRSNHREFPQLERYTYGAVALIATSSSIIELRHVLTGFFGALPGWPAKAHALASLLVTAALGYWALLRFGRMSGWQMPRRASTELINYASNPAGNHMSGHMRNDAYAQPQRQPAPMAPPTQSPTQPAPYYPPDAAQPHGAAAINPSAPYGPSHAPEQPSPAAAPLPMPSRERY